MPEPLKRWFLSARAAARLLSLAVIVAVVLTLVSISIPGLRLTWRCSSLMAAALLALAAALHFKFALDGAFETLFVAEVD